MDKIVRFGRVVRGYLGVELTPELNPELVSSLELPSDQGALIARVVRKGPADDAGLRRGDFITEFDGTRVTGMRQLQLLVADASPASAVKVKFIRNAKEQSLDVMLGERQANSTIQSPMESE
jgi:serine protease DegQ